MKRVAVLGSTGSIGTQTLDIARSHPDRIRIVSLAARRNSAVLRQQAAEFGVNRLALYEGDETDIPTGIEAIADLAASGDVDLVVVAVAGVIGLLPTIRAIQAGKDIALASKEVLVAAGEIVMPLVRDRQVKITPIDSEHSAVFQCLQGHTSSQVKSLTLTASGGPFRGRNRQDLASITAAEALAHPTWKMGGKITIDSATLMNKGLEVIEAKWLFGIPTSSVNVVVHPQSIVHSFVEFQDGSYLAQLGWPDMRLPIQYALLHPERIPNQLAPWSPVQTPSLTFEPPDHDTFPAIQLARRADQIGNTAPCALNAANEEAANLFLQGKGAFLAITDNVQSVIETHRPTDVTLESLMEVDRWARAEVRKLLNL